MNRFNDIKLSSAINYDQISVGTESRQNYPAKPKLFLKQKNSWY